MADKEVAVLDIGSSKITVVIGARGVNNTFNIRGWGECDYDGFGEGKFYEETKLREVFKIAVAQAETNAQTEIEKIYVGVPGDFTSCFVKDVSVSLDRKRRIEHADIEDLFKQGKYSFINETINNKIISCSPVYFTLDDNRRIQNPVGEVSTKLSGSITYIFSDTVFLQAISNNLKDIGIEEIEFVPSVLAEILYLFEPEKRDGYVVLIDVGHITTNLILARGDGILGLKTIQMGGGHITGALYANFEPPEYAIAEALKRQIVLTLNAGKKDEYEVNYKTNIYKFNAAEANEIVAECLDGLAQIIRQELNTFEYQYPEYINFHLTGGGIAYLRGAKQILSKSLDKQIELVMPVVPLFDKPTLSSILGLLDDAIEKNSLLIQKISIFTRIKRRLRLK